jgi:hypothetical protein
VPGMVLFLIIVGLCTIVCLISRRGIVASDAYQFEVSQFAAQHQELRTFSTTVNTTSTLSEEIIVSSGDASSSVTNQKKFQQEDSSRFKCDDKLLKYFKLAAVLALNAVVLVVVNGIYVLLQIRGNRFTSNSFYVISAIQIIFAIVKLVWNNWLLAELFAWVGLSSVSSEQQQLSAAVSSFSSRSSFFRIHAALLMFNNIAIPCLVVICVSQQCIYEVFNPPAAIKSSFGYGYCNKFGSVNGSGVYGFVNSTFVCTDFELTAVQQTSFDPAFQYSFQCSSSFVTYYAGAFIYMFIINGFVGPLLQILLRYLLIKLQKSSALHKALKASILRLYQPADKDEIVSLTRTNKGHYLINCAWYQLQFVTWFSLLLTFGAAFPPLGVTIFTSMIVNGYMKLFMMKRLLVEAQNLDCLAIYEDKLGQDCNNAFNPLPRVRWILLGFVSGFHTLFVFDTIGYQVGSRHAMWTIIVTPLLPVVFWLIIKFYSSEPQSKIVHSLLSVSQIISCYCDDDRTPLRPSSAPISSTSEQSSDQNL